VVDGSVSSYLFSGIYMIYRIIDIDMEDKRRSY
jgi:hypothetical protein